MTLSKSKKFLENELKKIFKKELGVSVHSKSKIYDYEKWDSLANFNILLSCENKFKIKFNSSEFTNLSSFNKIFLSVSKKLK